MEPKGQDWHTFAKYVDDIEAARSKQRLLEAFKRAVARFEFIHVGIGQLINPARANQPLTEYGISDFPDEFTARWFDESLIIHDPITRYASKARNVFTWEQARVYSGKFGLKMLEEARELDMINGIGVPVVIPKMPVGLITMSHADPDFSTKDLLQIELLSIHAYSQFLDITNKKPSAERLALTDRETEILHYVAGGHTNWEIGVILSISEETVRVHTKNIMRKLNAVNRTHSVTIAINNGDIMP
ncbi:MAG: helix-turn-helix transcriptional regulator [Maricaulaceae bacterium]